MLTLSLFPGIDLLGRGFEAEGFCVVRGPDIIYGQSIYDFHVPSHRFDGIIGGSPCQDFSRARRTPPTGEGIALLNQFVRIIEEAQPTWFLLENVERVPDIHPTGYHVQRFDLNAKECGCAQSRLRHFQFGSTTGLVVMPQRFPPLGKSHIQPACLATEGRKKHRRTWSDFCQLQGLPPDFDLPGMTIEAKYRAVGNGVPIPMARTVARAIREATCETAQRCNTVRLCSCGCGRPLTGRNDQRSATPACRKRLEKRRRETLG